MWACSTCGGPAETKMSKRHQHPRFVSRPRPVYRAPGVLTWRCRGAFRGRAPFTRLLGCDLTQQVPVVADMLRNAEATAFNQDALGIQAVYAHEKER